MSRAIRQPVYKSGPGAIGQARRQIANMNYPAQSIVNGTMLLPNETAPVIEQEDYFLVVSPKFVGRYYIVRQVEGMWLTSSKEEKFIPQLIAKVEQFIAEQYEMAEAA